MILPIGAPLTVGLDAFRCLAGHAVDKRYKIVALTTELLKLFVLSLDALT